MIASRAPAFMARTLHLLTSALMAAALVCVAGLSGTAVHAQQRGGYGTPALSALDRLAGQYDVDGRNPNGSQYDGRVEITVRDDVAYFRWDIGSQVFKGQGTLAGNVLTVDWGQADPVIYIVQDDGSLHGTWSNGRASERLTPRN